MILNHSWQRMGRDGAGTGGAWAEKKGIWTAGVSARAQASWSPCGAARSAAPSFALPAVGVTQALRQAAQVVTLWVRSSAGAGLAEGRQGKPTQPDGPASEEEMHLHFPLWA